MNLTVTIYTARTNLTEVQVRDKLAELTGAKVIINGPGYIDQLTREQVHLYTFVHINGEQSVKVKRKAREAFPGSVKSAY